MKKILFSFILIAALACIGYFAWQQYTLPEPEIHLAHPETERTTTSGKIVGFTEDNGAHAWLGIPYARPPVGDLRWGAPLPPRPWDGTRKALDVCPVCPQYGGPLSVDSKKQFDIPVGSEDCLYLNIWAPAFPPDAVPTGADRLPVMMWIHGGGNSVGHGGYYRGKVLAARYKVVLVTINYRLGPLGWFSHPALRETAASLADRSGNYGTLDIVRALEWLRDNISYFGGNPDKVTVFGESAGAVDTLSMMLSPYAEGLFHRAAVQSGMARVTPVSRAENFMDDPGGGGHPQSSREIVNRLLTADYHLDGRTEAVSRQNAMSSDDLAAYLRSKSSADILRAYTPGPFGMIRFPALIQDGEVLPKGDPLEIFKDAAKYNTVPLIIGTNRDEYKLFMAQDPEFVDRYLGIIARFKNEDFYHLFAAYKSDLWKAVGVDEIARSIHQSAGEAVYAYRFDWDEEPSFLGMDFAKLIGAAHGLEIPFVFNSFDTNNRMMNMFFTPENQPGRMTLSDRMSAYWVQFARTGDPAKGVDHQQVEWRPWDGGGPAADTFIVFDTGADGGIRMSSEIVRITDVKSRFLADTGFPDLNAKCNTYVSLFENTPLWNEEEYQSLDGRGCGN